MPEREKPRYAPWLVNRAARGFAWLASKVFWSIKFHGMENIPPTDAFPYIVASNHQAYFDPAWIAAKIDQKLAFMAWREAFEWKFVGTMIRYMGAFPVSLEGGAKALASIKTALRVLKDGAVLVIFPEGERAFEDGNMLEFKDGVAAIAIRAQVPVMPVTIKGGNRVWAQGQKGPSYFTPVEVTYHRLIDPPATDDGAACESFTAEIKAAIGRSL